MANEDSRENSVLGTALKVAAAGGAIYAGGRTGIKYKDVIGGTGMGKAFKEGIANLSDEGIQGAVKSGVNKARGKASDIQENILEKDFTNVLKKQNKVLEKGNAKVSKEYTDVLHNEYKGQSSASEKRSFNQSIKHSTAGTKAQVDLHGEAGVSAGVNLGMYEKL